MKKLFIISLCVLISIAVAACDKTASNEDTNGIESTDTVINTETIETESTEPTQSEQPNDNNNDDSLIKKYDEDEFISPLNGKIKMLLEATNFAAYAGESIYYIDIDSMHEFHIGEVDEIIFYDKKVGSSIYKFVSDELCAYTKKDGKLYVSITARSDDETYSEAYTASAPCTKDEFVYACRDVDVVYIVFERNGDLMCMEHDFESNQSSEPSKIVGVTKEKVQLELRTVETDGTNVYALTKNNDCYQIDTLGDTVEKTRDGQYYVELTNDFLFPNVKKVFAYGLDNEFIRTDDNLNIYVHDYNGNNEMVTTTVKLPAGLTTDDIENVWAMSWKEGLVKFNNGSYYTFTRVNSYSSATTTYMEELIIPNINDLEILGFDYRGFDLLILMSDGCIYICDDIL